MRQRSGASVPLVELCGPARVTIYISGFWTVNFPTRYRVADSVLVTLDDYCNVPLTLQHDMQQTDFYLNREYYLLI